MRLEAERHVASRPLAEQPILEHHYLGSGVPRRDQVQLRPEARLRSFSVVSAQIQAHRIKRDTATRSLLEVSMHIMDAAGTLPPFDA